MGLSEIQLKPAPTAGSVPGPVAPRGQGGVRAVIQTVGARLVIQVVNAGTGIITARYLMPAGRGQLAAMTLWSLFLAGLTTLGIPSSLVYFLKSRPDRRSDLITSGLVMAGVLGVVTGLVGALFMPQFLHKYPLWVIRDAQWLMIVTPICSLSFVGRAILESHGEFSASNLAQLLSPLTTLIALLVLIVSHRVTVLGAALCYIIAIVPVAMLLTLRVWPYVERGARITTSGCKLLLSYGVRSYWIDLLGSLSLQVDQVLVITLLTPADMGLYVVMLSLSRTANVFQNAVTTVLFPKATGQTVEHIRKLTGRAARVSLTITACATSLIGIFGPFLLRIFYGKDYTTAASCLRILLVEVTLSGLVFILAQAFMALNFPGTVSILQGIGLGLSVPFMLLLIPRFGITGAALALLLSTSARLCFICAGFPIYLKTRVPDLRPRSEDFTSLLHAFHRPARSS